MLGRGMARFNRQVLNRLTRPLARHLPGFGVIIHRGRRTDRLYKTPVNVFRHDGDYVVALTYGPESDWVKNVLAAASCELVPSAAASRLSHPISSTTRADALSRLSFGRCYGFCVLRISYT